MSHTGSRRHGVIRWFGARSRSALTIVVAGVACTAAPVSAQPVTPVSLMTVTGHWTASTDSVHTLTVDGTKWSGTTDSLSLARASMQLFGAVDPQFLRNGQSSGAFPLAVASAIARFGNGTLRVRFNLRGGASDQNAGIVFGLQPDGSYHYLRYNTKDGDLALWTFANGERRNISHSDTKQQLPLGRWHTLEVQLDGTRLTARVVEVDALRFTHTFESAPVGRVGVWVKRDAVTSFQGFDATASVSR
jgi:hypothetical protein